MKLIFHEVSEITVAYDAAPWESSALTNLLFKMTIINILKTDFFLCPLLHSWSHHFYDILVLWGVFKTRWKFEINQTLGMPSVSSFVCECQKIFSWKLDWDWNGPIYIFNFIFSTMLLLLLFFEWKTIYLLFSHFHFIFLFIFISFFGRQQWTTILYPLKT